ncbi:hypothetical protein CJ177_43565 [Rhodococcus sp. ACPA1]|nr:hypothetical protein CJ177_43565 [Rhodococcus sp. ACPA1]
MQTFLVELNTKREAEFDGLHQVVLDEEGCGRHTWLYFMLLSSMIRGTGSPGAVTLGTLSNNRPAQSRQHPTSPVKACVAAFTFNIDGLLFSVLPRVRP